MRRPTNDFDQPSRAPATLLRKWMVSDRAAAAVPLASALRGTSTTARALASSLAHDACDGSLIIVMNTDVIVAETIKAIQLGEMH